MHLLWPQWTFQLFADSVEPTSSQRGREATAPGDGAEVLLRPDRRGFWHLHRSSPPIELICLTDAQSANPSSATHMGSCVVILFLWLLWLALSFKRMCLLQKVGIAFLYFFCFLRLPPVFTFEFGLLPRCKANLLTKTLRRQRHLATPHHSLEAMAAPQSKHKTHKQLWAPSSSREKKKHLSLIAQSYLLT